MRGFRWDLDGWTTVAIAVTVLIAAVTFIRYGPFAILQRRAGRQMPSTTLRPYTANTVERFLRDAQEGARGRFRLGLWIDCLFAVVYSIGLVLVLDGTLGLAAMDKAAFRWLLWIPLLAGGADVLENLLLLWAVRRDDVRVRFGPVILANVMTWAKWLGVYLAAIMILAGAVSLGIAGPRRWELHQLGDPLVATLILVVIGQMVLGLPGTRPFRRQVAGAVLTLLVAAIGAGVIASVPHVDVSLSSLGMYPIEKTCDRYSIITFLLAFGVVALLWVWRPSLLGSQRDSRFEDLEGRDLMVKIGGLIPITVLFEELAFRGVLYQIWLHAYGESETIAVAATAVAFGLWHVRASQNRVTENRSASPLERGGSSIVATVLFTAAAGLLFGLLRAASDCLWPSVFLHWGANAAGVVFLVQNARRREA